MNEDISLTQVGSLGRWKPPLTFDLACCRRGPVEKLFIFDWAVQLSPGSFPFISFAGLVLDARCGSDSQVC